MHFLRLFVTFEDIIGTKRWYYKGIRWPKIAIFAVL